MKKSCMLVLVIALVFCVLGYIVVDRCILVEMSLNYSCDGEVDGLWICVNEKGKRCFANAYICTEYEENQEITIPDEYDDKPITKIGGYSGRGVPSPFSISLEDEDLCVNAPEGSEYHAIFSGGSDFEENLPDNCSVQELPFVLNIGKNVKKIEYVVMDEYYPHINQDGSVTFYHPTVYINCSEENKYFYSENGKLYNKKTDELVSDFSYAEE